MNHVSKIYRSRAAGQLNDSPHRCERINILGIKIELQRVDEFPRVFHFLRPFNERSQNFQRFIILTWPALAFFVFPVRGDTFFRYEVHLLSANLHFKWLALGTNYGGMQRLIEVIPRRGNPIFESSRHGFPGVVNNTQRAIAVTNLVGSDHARRNQVVNLIDIDLLRAQLLPD